jgi:hypothetical protein
MFSGTSCWLQVASIVDPVDNAESNRDVCKEMGVPKDIPIDNTHHRNQNNR